MPIIALATVIAVLLQLNGMFIIWKIQLAKQDDAIRAFRIHPAFILVTGLKCLWQNFQPAYRHPGWKNRDLGNRASPPSHEQHIENFTKDSEVRRDLGNQLGQPDREY